jgi:hypothetical protein
MTLNQIIDYTQTQHPFAMVIRHSIREEVKDITQSALALLTGEGKALAKNFGEQLPTDKKIRLFHSQVTRCKETAEAIAQGFKGISASITEHPYMTGFYLHDYKPVLKDAAQIGSFEFMKRWFDGAYNEAWIMNALEARNYMTDSVLKNFDTNFLDLYITHDWNIATLYSYHHTLQEQQYIWPDFMSGVCYNQNAGGDFSICCESPAQIIIS